VKIQTKQASEFGRTVTLYRATTDDGSKGTLWHSTEAKAVGHFERKGWK
jgi:hypothetical protein